jgi:TonB family protein
VSDCKINALFNMRGIVIAKRFRRAMGLGVTLLVFWPGGESAVSAQQKDIQQQLSMLLKNKAIRLKSFINSDKLDFDVNSQPKYVDITGSWTLYSQILITKVDLSPMRLHLSGLRVVSHFDPKLKKLVESKSDVKVSLYLDLRKDATFAEIEGALAKLLVGPEGLIPYVPNYWKKYFGGTNNQKPCGQTGTPSPAPRGGAVVNPVVISRLEPEYSEMARRFLLEGTVQIQAEITEKGDIGVMNILVPAGAGFDEAAVESIAQWKFKPATLNGSPVCMMSTVTVSYRRH